MGVDETIACFVIICTEKVSFHHLFVVETDTFGQVEREANGVSVGRRGCGGDAGGLCRRWDSITSQGFGAYPIVV